MTTTTEKVTYTYEDVLAELREIIKGREFYVYQAPDYSGSCVNFDREGNPSCLVGHWLAMHGITEDFFDEYELSFASTVSDLFCNNADVMPMQVDERALKLLILAQQRQDSFNTWGNAVETSSRDVVEEYTS
jgi:predicted transcriptional regulator